MIPIEVIYQDIMDHPQEYTDWVNGMVRDVVRTTVITYIHLGIFIGILKYVF
jgi:hypothetical protein